MADKKFGVVHLEVIQDPGLSLRAKGLYALLCTYANKNRECYPSITTLSEISGVTRRTIERTLKELEDKHYVTRNGKIFIVG
jgi:DNA-binding MarR family transcriptional regulator